MCILLYLWGLGCVVVYLKTLQAMAPSLCLSWPRAHQSSRSSAHSCPVSSRFASLVVVLVYWFVDILSHFIVRCSSTLFPVVYAVSSPLGAGTLHRAHRTRSVLAHDTSWSTSYPLGPCPVVTLRRRPSIPLKVKNKCRARATSRTRPKVGATLQLDAISRNDCALIVAMCISSLPKVLSLPLMESLVLPCGFHTQSPTCPSPARHLVPAFLHRVLRRPGPRVIEEDAVHV